jgi:hypothetical protein
VMLGQLPAAERPTAQRTGNRRIHEYVTPKQNRQRTL